MNKIIGYCVLIYIMMKCLHLIKNWHHYLKISFSIGEFSMIYYIHEQKSKSTNLDVLLAIGQFISITFFCFYSFTDICFDTIDRVIPSPLIIAILVYMYLDVIYGLIRVDKFFVKAIFNLIITVLLMLSWLSVNKYVVYLGASIYLRIP